ncbi:hypothetical protein JAAARDRAFT_209689 [Jaapia argillacea MUCL 33604]|uniref:3'-5' exonuclease domain-containing protein n=1 Tax=Jaapia argillacea MUCL 33604 TaxID=933084 RepID=A0A067PGM8_9AGAM|nr:hypothetical protein JAAARDRAFT_209689 [Jaapia argillacea MUCL 33604]
MNPTSVSYTLCDTGVAVEQAVSHLMASPFVLLDCEGRDLGKRGGALSLICIGTSKAETIYVFDVPTLSQSGSSIATLFELLRSKEVKKVMWDGRMDFVSILDTFGVGIENVVDLQVAEVVSRGVIRGEGEKQRLRHLHTKPEDLVHVCAGCRCRLAVDVFVNRTRRFGESRRVQRLSRCRVCNLMAGKKGLKPDVDWVDV